MKSDVDKTTKIAAKSKRVLRVVLLKVSCDRKKQQGLPSLEEDRQVGGNYHSTMQKVV